MSAAAALFEKGCEDAARGSPHNEYHAARALASIAISLKRIADNGVTIKLDTSLSEQQYGDLLNNVQQIAWEAGRAFQHGTRSDR